MLIAGTASLQANSAFGEGRIRIKDFDEKMLYIGWSQWSW